MNINNNENVIQICEYIFNSICHRQKQLKKDGDFLNRLALLEEYREWITDGIINEHIIYTVPQEKFRDNN